MVEAQTQAVDKTRRSGRLSREPEEQVAKPDESATALPDYESLDFKQMLAICPLGGIELIRIREFPRDTEFDSTD